MSKFSDPGNDWENSLRSLKTSGSSRVNKTLPPAVAAPSIPARTGVGAPVSAKAGALSGATLKGQQVVTSSDGIFTIVYPAAIETTVGETTLVIPAISAT